MGEGETSEELVGANFAKVLSQHGHGFHYAVLKVAADLREARRSRWDLQADEFPVSVTDEVTHVDFVLKNDPGRTYLIGECKRADPARARWCFIPAPYTWRDSKEHEIVLEEIEVVSDAICRAQSRLAPTDHGPYHIGVELRTGQAGDGIPSGRAIADASAQVLRGMNGVARHLFGRTGQPFTTRGRTWFLPVIFTTAELWVSDTDLREADLKSGRLARTDARRVAWLWFTHNQSPALGHRLFREMGLRDLSTDLCREYARSIAIVAAEGVEQFLSADFEGYWG